MRTKKGFTLIELLVVIAIIGLLSSVVLASLNSARESGRDARRVSDINQMALALQLYFDDQGNYPIQQPAADTVQNALGDVVTQGFMTILPDDPSTGRDYYYRSDTNGTEYCIGADVEGDVPDNNNSACVTALANSMDFAVGEGDASAW